MRPRLTGSCQPLATALRQGQRGGAAITVLVILLLLCGLLVAGFALALKTNELKVHCQIGGVFAGGHYCTFTNETPMLPGRKCVRVKVAANRGVAVAYSSPTCSSIMLGKNVEKVDVAEFDRSLREICPSFDDCSLNILDDNENTAALMASRPSFEQEARAAPPVIVSQTEYDQIQTGMSYKRVKAIIGSEGREMNRNELAGYVTIMMEWNNPDRSSMTLMFQNGRVTMKNQFRLPYAK